MILNWRSIMISWQLVVGVLKAGAYVFVCRVPYKLAGVPQQELHKGTVLQD